MNILLGTVFTPRISGAFSGPTISGAFTGHTISGTLVDANGKHDIVLLENNASLSGGLDQRIDCTLRTFQGEWWLDPSEGVPYFTDIFKKSPDLATVRQALATVIQRVPGVQRIDRLEVSLNRGTRVLSVDFAVTGTDKVAYYRVTEVAV